MEASQITDIFIAAGAFGPGLLALMFALVWRAQREAWAAFFAGGYLLTAAIYGALLVTRSESHTAVVFSSIFALLSLLLKTVGFVRYVDLPRAMARKIEAAGGFLAALYVAALLTGMEGHLLGFGMLSGLMICQAVMAVWAMRREPGYGHGLVFAALMLYPAIVVLIAVGVIDSRWLRYANIAPTIVSGATLLTVGLLRAQYRASAELRRRKQAESSLQSLNDTLEQRVAQRTAELNEMIGGLESFNRSVSHDLRGPLGGIAGVSRLAGDALARQDTATVQRMLAVITTQADALGQLVNDLLSLARVSDADLVPQPIELRGFVRDTLEQMRLAQPDGQPLSVEVGELPTVEADPGLLRQVYVNLLGNAIKFSHGAQAPHIELGAFERDGEQVFFVRDNGVGFDADQAKRLFQPFRRLHGQRFAGHGVGLSIVKRIVERHGGRLWAQAQPNMGATFFFSLPRFAETPGPGQGLTARLCASAA